MGIKTYHLPVCQNTLLYINRKLLLAKIPCVNTAVIIGVTFKIPLVEDIIFLVKRLFFKSLFFLVQFYTENTS